MTTLVIADDHKMFCEGLSSILSQEKDIEIIGCVENGIKLLEFLSTNEVDIILLDINMEGVGGVESANIILKKYPHIRIIIVSMYKKPTIVSNLLNMGVHGYVLKDSGGRELIKAIRTVINGKKYFDIEVKNAMIKQFTDAEPNIVMQLTSRETEILKCICRSLTSKEIANELSISINTVETHRKNIMSKTGAANSVALVRFAFENQLI